MGRCDYEYKSNDECDERRCNRNDGRRLHGYCRQNMVDSNPKLKKKANKAFKTMESVLDTAQYMFR